MASSRVESSFQNLRLVLDSHSTQLNSRVHSNSSPRTRQKHSNTPPLQRFDAAKCSKRHRGITDLRVHDINAEITRHPMSGVAFLERRSVGTLECWSVGVLECWRGGAFLERLSNVGALECWSILEAFERWRGGASEQFRSAGALERWSVFGASVRLSTVMPLAKLLRPESYAAIQVIGNFCGTAEVWAGLKN